MVRAAGLTRRYGRETALDAVSFEVSEGDVFGVFGDNGSGKTTLLRLLAGVLRADGGDVWIAGQSVTGELGAVRRLIGYVPQSPTADLDLTAEENLEFHCGLFGLPRGRWRARIGEMLAVAGLEDRRHRPVRTFSGGMRRRLEIARALLHQPRILLLDEPAAGLDPQACEAVWLALDKLRDVSGATLVLATHRLAEDGPRCTAGLLLRRGVVAAQGRLEELRSQSSARQRVRIRMAAGPSDWPMTLADLPGLTRARAEGAGWTLLCDDPQTACRRILDRAALDGVGLAALQFEEPSMPELLEAGGS